MGGWVGDLSLLILALSGWVGGWFTFFFPTQTNGLPRAASREELVDEVESHVSLDWEVESLVGSD